MRGHALQCMAGPNISGLCSIGASRLQGRQQQARALGLRGRPAAVWCRDMLV